MTAAVDEKRQAKLKELTSWDLSPHLAAVMVWC
jgi:hypothetical protein